MCRGYPVEALTRNTGSSKMISSTNVFSLNRESAFMRARLLLLEMVMFSVPCACSIKSLET